MIRIHYCKAYDVDRLQELTNKMIDLFEKEGNEIIGIQSFVTSDKAFYSQIVYKERKDK